MKSNHDTKLESIEKMVKEKMSAFERKIEENTSMIKEQEIRLDYLKRKKEEYIKVMHKKK